MIEQDEVRAKKSSLDQSVKRHKADIEFLEGLIVRLQELCIHFWEKTHYDATADIQYKRCVKCDKND